MRSGFGIRGGDGLASDHTVGLFQRDPNNPNVRWQLIAKATVPAGTTAPLQGGYRWVSLGQTITLPNTLPAGADANYGQYAILADGGTDPMGGAASNDTVPLVDGGAIAASIPGNPSCYWAVGWPSATESVPVTSMAVGASSPCSGHGLVWFGPNARYVAQTSTFKITPTAGTGGTIDPDVAVDVPTGTDQSFTITANDGYVIDIVLVDGVDKTAEVISGSYTFTNVTETHTIHATFKTTFANWIDTLYPALSVKTPEGDPDGDGRNNLMEFALNGDPSNGSVNGRVYSFTGKSADFSNDVLILTLAVRAGTLFPEGDNVAPSASKDGVKYTIEGSPDLLNFDGHVWTNGKVILPDGAPTDAGDGYEYRSFVLISSDGLTGKGFLRVRVEPAP